MEEAGPLVLDDYLPYLLNRAGSRIAGAFTREAQEHGLTLPMWRVLAALQEEEDRRIGELAAITSTEISTLSRVLDGLEKRALVVRRRAAEDARTVRVRRTEAGIAVTDRLLPLARHYEEQALAGFEIEEIGHLKSLLRRLYDNMAVLDAESDARPETA